MTQTQSPTKPPNRKGRKPSGDPRVQRCYILSEKAYVALQEAGVGRYMSKIVRQGVQRVLATDEPIPQPDTRGFSCRFQAQMTAPLLEGLAKRARTEDVPLSWIVEAGVLAELKARGLIDASH